MFAVSTTSRTCSHRLKSCSERMATTADVPLLITSDNARSERRISPAWTIAQLKGRLEPITGIPASSQRLTLKVASWPDQNLQTVDEENTQLGAFTLQSYAELHVSLNSICFSICTERSCHDSYMMSRLGLRRAWTRADACIPSRTFKSSLVGPLMCSAQEIVWTHLHDTEPAQWDMGPGKCTQTVSTPTTLLVLLR